MTARGTRGLWTCVFALLGAFGYGSYLANLRTTLAPTTGGEFGAIYQVLHNNATGAPFESSVIGMQVPGVAAQAGRFSYLLIHFYVLPFALFRLLGSAGPVGVLTAMLLGNVLLLAAFAAVILRRLSPQDWRGKWAFSLALLSISGSLNLLGQQGAPPLLAAPCLFAAYAAMLAGRKGWYLAALAALCLVSEELSLAAISFSLYVRLFEPERRSFALPGAVLGAAYFLLTVGLVQPFLRAAVGAQDSSTFLAFSHLVAPALLHPNWTFLLTLAALPFAFLATLMLYPSPDPAGRRRMLGMALVAPLPFWGVTLVLGGAHHLIVPFTCCALALLRAIGEAPPDHSLSRREPAVSLACALLAAAGARVMFVHFPLSLRMRAYHAFGRHEMGARLKRARYVGRASNLAVIRAAAELPPEKGVTVWVNDSATAFLTGRRSIWYFPFRYREADYLLLQKDAYDLKFGFDPAAGPDSGRQDWSGAPMAPASLESLRGELVRKAKTHRVSLENEHVIILEKI
jgi:hypothetical protein